MDSTFALPADYQNALQRFLPYMIQELRNDQKSLEAILLFYKLGGDKLARIAIDAFNQTLRLQNAQAHRLRLKAAMMDALEEAEKDDDDDDDGDRTETTDGSDKNDDEIPEY